MIPRASQPPAPTHITTSERLTSGISQYSVVITTCALNTGAEANLSSATHLPSDLRQGLRITKLQLPGLQNQGRYAKVS